MDTNNTCTCQLCKQPLTAIPQFLSTGYVIMVTCYNPVCDAIDITVDRAEYDALDMVTYAASVKAGRR